MLRERSKITWTITVKEWIKSENFGGHGGERWVGDEGGEHSAGELMEGKMY